MSIVRTEGFDYLPTITNTGSTVLAKLYGALGFYDWFMSGSTSILPTIRDVDPVFGYGKYMRITGLAASGGIGLVLPPGPFASLWHGLHLRTLGDNANYGGWVDFLSSADEVVSLRYDDFGIVRAYRNDIQIGASSPGSFPEFIWFHTEIAVIHNGDMTMDVIVRVNGTTVLSLVDRPTTTFSTDAVKYRGDGQAEIDIDNLYFDNEGFLGAVRCQWLPNIASGLSTTWTSFNGVMPNWQAASNPDADDDQYVFKLVTGIGDYDLYDIASMIATAEVFAVSIKGAYRQSDATQRYVQNVVQSGATLFDGALTAANPTYRFVIDVLNVDPNTGSAWTAAAVNSLQVGPKLGA